MGFTVFAERKEMDVCLYERTHGAGLRLRVACLNGIPSIDRWVTSLWKLRIIEQLWKTLSDFSVDVEEATIAVFLFFF